MCLLLDPGLPLAQCALTSSFPPAPVQLFADPLLPLASTNEASLFLRWVQTEDGMVSAVVRLFQSIRDHAARWEMEGVAGTDRNLSQVGQEALPWGRTQKIRGGQHAHRARGEQNSATKQTNLISGTHTTHTFTLQLHPKALVVKRVYFYMWADFLCFGFL